MYKIHTKNNIKTAQLAFFLFFIESTVNPIPIIEHTAKLTI